MNDDDYKGLFDRSLHEGGMEGAPGPDEGRIAGRIRGVRRRRAATSAVAGVASVALVAAVVWQLGGLGNDPNPPATPTETSTQDPTTEPSPTDESSEATDPADWSDAIFPACGDTFTGLPERTSQLVVTQGPGEPLAAGAAFVTEIENTGTTQIAGEVALPQTVVVDGDGVVVATVDLEDSVFWGAEGGIHVAIAGGESLPFWVSESWTCDGEQVALGSGEYELYVVATVGEIGSTDPGQLEQIQGGPFPLVIDESLEPVQSSPSTVPDGAIPWGAECGDAWTAPEPTTGDELTLTDQLPPSRPVGEPITGGAQLRVTGQMSGSIYTDVVLVQDGTIVTAPFAGDSHFTYYLSEGSLIDLEIESLPYGCDGELVPAGDYQAVVLVLTTQFDGEDVQTSVLAASDAVDITLG